MNVEHIVWTRNALRKVPLDRFEKWFKPHEPYNFHIMVRRLNGTGVGNLFLRVPSSDLREFVDLYRRIREVDNSPVHLGVLESPGPRCKLFLDIEMREELSKVRVGELLYKVYPNVSFRILAKPGQSKRFHVVWEKEAKWNTVKKLVFNTIIPGLEGLEDSTPDAKTLRLGIDLQPYGRPANLRAPLSFKVWNPDHSAHDYYKFVAFVAAGGWMGTPEEVAEERREVYILDHLAQCFLTPAELAVAATSAVAWTTNGRLLPVPNFAPLLSFDYEREPLRFEVLDRTFRGAVQALALNLEEALELDDWNELQLRMVTVLNKYWAHVRGMGVYVVAEPTNYDPRQSFTETRLLRRRTFRLYKLSDFSRDLQDLSHTLLLPNKTKPRAVQWTAVWLAHHSHAIYDASYGFSTPLRSPSGHTPRVFNTWTGPGVTPSEAFAAVARAPLVARACVDLWVEFLETVVAGDPFETPAYNKYFFQLLVAFFVWTLKFPHLTFPLIMYLWSAEQGVGKGQTAAMLTALAGLANTSTRVGVQGMSGFAGYLADKILWIMDEESEQGQHDAAMGQIKHIATDPIITADKKFQAPIDVNLTLSILVTSNRLWPLELVERRWAVAAINSVHRGDTVYWRKLVDTCLTGDGPLYIAAWLYGITPSPEVRPGMVPVKGYVRLRQAERMEKNDPLQNLLMPWFSSATQARQTTYAWAQEDGEFMAHEIEAPVFQIDRFEPTLIPCTRAFLEDWGKGGPPSAFGHYNQPLLVGTVVVRPALLDLLSTQRKKYGRTELSRGTAKTFGEKYEILFSNNSHDQTFGLVMLKDYDDYMQRLMEKLANLIRVHFGGEDAEEVENVWPIPMERLLAFAQHGVEVTEGPNIRTYSVKNYYEGTPQHSRPQDFIIWPPADVCRALGFEAAGGGRTPDHEIPDMSCNHLWYKQGFTRLTPWNTVEEAEASVARADPRLAHLAELQAQF